MSIIWKYLIILSLISCQKTIEMVENNETKMLFCEYEGCSYKHEWQSKIIQHVKAVHQLIKDFNCDECQKSFGRSFNLKRHKQIVHLQEKLFVCEICKKTYTTKQNREIHQKQVHEKIELEQNVEDNQFDTSSLNTNSELENPIENVVDKKRDKNVQLTIRVRKLTPAKIEVYRGGKSLQPRVLITKLKDFELPFDKQKCRKKCHTTTKEKSQSKMKISKEKKCFVYKYNYDYWSNRTPPQTKPKTLQRIILNDCADEKKPVPKVRKLKEFNIFKHLDLEYSRSKYYTGPECNED